MTKKDEVITQHGAWTNDDVEYRPGEFTMGDRRQARCVFCADR